MEMKNRKEMFTQMAGECFDMMTGDKSKSDDPCENFSKEKMEKMMADCGCGPKQKEKIAEFMNSCGCGEKE